MSKTCFNVYVAAVLALISAKLQLSVSALASAANTVPPSPLTFTTPAGEQSHGRGRLPELLKDFLATRLAEATPEPEGPPPAVLHPISSLTPSATGNEQHR